jgi:hypothetical protein
MPSEIDKMRSLYGLRNAVSIYSLLEDFGSEEMVREFCWKVLHAYPDLKKEICLVGLEGGDYIYSFEGNYVFICDDSWTFDLFAKDMVLLLICKKMIDLKAKG